MKKPAGTDRLWTRNFILLTFSVFLISTAFYFLMPTLPVFLEKELGAGKREVGIIVATSTLAAILIRPFSGYILDYFGRKIIFILSIVLYSILFAFYPLALTLAPLLLIRFLHGLNWGASTTAGFTLIVDFIPFQKRGRGIGYFGLSFTVAMSVGSVLGLEVMGQDRFEALFLTAAAVSIAGVMMAALIRFPEYVRPDKKKIRWSSLVAFPSLQVSVNILILAVTYGGVLTFIGLYAKEINLSEYTGWFFTVTAVGTALTRIFSGRLFDRYGPTWISVFGIIAVSGGLMLLGQAPVRSLFLLSGFVIGIGFGVIFPTLQTMANNVVTHEHRGSANSTFLTGLDMGIGLGSVLTGLLSTLLGLAWTFKAASLVALAGLVYFLVFSLPHYTKNRIID